ncbi:hypothetical protein KAFR_0J02090 [Kazachstania africana CBS 2517]|uniref:50S ribosomal protein L35 n=1 Tax=Kazachstania africana (strain ATCC 22294 / BCRC 22015 / CBS 2517 / CECT 1963 / NBRC 1671 / NRRL Y-8276) TaxID=1071382 RepID=H2B0X3_KAZAF|nr:hypothetical protein KAFR_0J02090 [Kazachstania africana CBS 2517]CCF60273.1 hypothetical protein KAFR_0J02090 [Kazachstania africana CBS 2517]
MLFKPFFSALFTMGSSVVRRESPTLIIARNLMKTHKGTAKRWRKTANGFKRGIAGRNHGNGGWSRRSLKCLTGRKTATPSQAKRLKRLLPFG